MGSQREGGIAWTDQTWNCVTGCTKVSAGCKHCYAERVFPRAYSDEQMVVNSMTGARRFGNVVAEQEFLAPRKFTDVRCHEDRLAQPLHWKKPRRIFVNSISDLFHEDVPDKFIAAVFGIMAAAMEHTFQILTKRPQRVLEWFKWIDSFGGIGKYIRSDEGRRDLRVIIGNPEISRIETHRSGRKYRSSDDPWAKTMNAAACVGRGEPLHNVWLGVSVEDQKTADERIPLLLQTPAAVRFVSYEPALEPILLAQVIPVKWNGKPGKPITVVDYLRGPQHIDWVIVGGESGPGARPFNIEWARSVIRQCQDAGVACFVKQMGANVQTRNDQVQDVWYYADGSDMETEELDADHYQGAPVRLRLNDRKGGDPDEWPSDLRVREFPQ